MKEVEKQKVRIVYINLLLLFLNPIINFGEMNPLVSFQFFFFIGLNLILFYLAYAQAGWDELEAGKYEFPFALKVKKKMEREIDEKV